MAGKLKHDLTGKRFGSLTVMNRSDYCGDGKKPEVIWDCRCDCGRITRVRTYGLLHGKTVSCGCKKKKHMESYKHKTRLYNIWTCMRQRCNNPNNPSFKNYGAKGVRISPEWSEYADFREWAYSHGYSEDLSIDRIDVNGNYEPSNCRWANTTTQANNTRRNHYIDFHGELLTMAEIARRMNVSYATIQHRVERGQPLEGKL